MEALVGAVACEGEYEGVVWVVWSDIVAWVGVDGESDGSGFEAILGVVADEGPGGGVGCCRVGYGGAVDFVGYV